ncbi:MAG: aspartate--ammonia ligase [Tannerella sp.]|jgi:aspartate--ammonia ligase|nr:aspartate--ammonia ligase [Tannerella sp.]
MNIFIPENYRPVLPPEETEGSIQKLKWSFENGLAEALNLRRVTAPLFVLSGTGVNDDLNGTERAVSFPVRDMGGRSAEVVHSLAKWKRLKLGQYRIPPGKGIYTDMNAIRADEELDNIHSLYVDQWDWERSIRPEDRSLAFLREMAEKVYGVVKAIEMQTCARIPSIAPVLPERLTFIHSEDLLAEWPHLPPREREREAARRHGAVFIIGIGMTLADGQKHDGRAPDYDDWSTSTGDGRHGLNGDIILWNPVLDGPFEISSMGIRVDRAALVRQLELEGCTGRSELAFHRALLAGGGIPLSVGGGIGQSRLCMFFLRCAHIGEVQASLWPEEMMTACSENNIILK